MGKAKTGTPAAIERIFIMYTFESCQRHSYYVVVATDEGLVKEVASHRTGSIYNNFQGLSCEEALDRALIDANTWGDFLNIEPDEYWEEGEVKKPSLEMSPYTIQRELLKRKELER